MHERQRGIIKVWNDEKGFGFIASAVGDPDIFFHITSVTNSRRRDLVGQRVTYALQPGRDGKPSAIDVRLAGASDDLLPNHYRSPWAVAFAWGVSLTFLAAAAFISIRNHHPFIAVAYVVLSIATYATYSHDKSCALTGNWRVPEARLHLMEFAGGWPGGLIAQWTLHHKNRKLSYQVAFWIIVIFHLAAFQFVLESKLG